MLWGEEAWGAGLKEKERKLRDTATAHSKKAEGLLVQMRAPWGEGRKRHLLKFPLPKMPASTLPPFGKWDGTGGGGGKSRCMPSLRPCMLGSQGPPPPTTSNPNLGPVCRWIPAQGASQCKHFDLYN